MRYRVLMSIEIDAAHDRQAYEHAVKLSQLLKNPMVRMAIAAEDVQLSDGDGHPVVHEPQRIA